MFKYDLCYIAALTAKVKGKLYKRIVRPAKLFGLVTMSLIKRQEEDLEVAESKMLRFFLGAMRMDGIRNNTSKGQHRSDGIKVKEA